MKTWRRIHILKETWSYKIINSYVIIKNPFNRQIKKVGANEILLMSWSEIERMQDKRCFSIYPSQIRDYIERTENRLI